jgi:coniferyl-aldehyde dehydrogenase
MNYMDLHRILTCSTKPAARRSMCLCWCAGRLLRLQKLLDQNGPALCAAVEQDFGVRSERWTEMLDLMLVRNMLKHTLKHLPKWSKRQRVRTPLMLQPGKAWVERQPLGVVGIISPWNYPLQLSLAPAITALAAGNRVMLKPSELTPQTSAKWPSWSPSSLRPKSSA